MTEYDSPWKESLEMFLKPFLEFFFLDIYAEIDWSRKYESLDKELHEIAPDSELGKRLADKLFKVCLIGGEELWIFIHTEVQNRQVEQFGERMYIYNYRTYDRYRHPVVSLAVLTDDQRRWRPREYAFRKWGFSLRMKFPMVKLLDYAKDIPGLEANPNPFAAVVLAHLKTMQTRRRPAERYYWKVRLVKGLFERGLTAEEIRQLFRLIDWLMDLPPDLDEKFTEEIHRFEEERKMPYVTSVERVFMKRGREKGRKEGRKEGRREGRKEGRKEGEVVGLQEGIELALEVKFGAEGLSLMPLVRAAQSAEKLRSIRQAIRTAETVDQVRTLLSQS